MSKILTKKDFEKEFCKFVKTLSSQVCDSMNNWTIKGFIDIHKNIYSISNDTKITTNKF